MSARIMKASPTDGDSVTRRIVVIRIDTMTSPRTGTPRESVRANTRGKRPSRAVASAVSALINVHPPRHPAPLTIAQIVISTAPIGPIASIVASAKGAEE